MADELAARAVLGVDVVAAGHAPGVLDPGQAEQPTGGDEPGGDDRRPLGRRRAGRRDVTQRAPLRLAHGGGARGPELPSGEALLEGGGELRGREGADGGGG